MFMRFILIHFLLWKQIMQTFFSPFFCGTVNIGRSLRSLALLLACSSFCFESFFPNRVEEQSSLISRNEEAKNNNIYFLFASGTGNASPPVVVIKDDSVQANVWGNGDWAAEEAMRGKRKGHAALFLQTGRLWAVRSWFVKVPGSWSE